MAFAVPHLASQVKLGLGVIITIPLSSFVCCDRTFSLQPPRG